MKYLTLSILIINMAAINLHSQTIVQERSTISAAGGLSSDNTYTNLVVMGQSAYGESGDNVYTVIGGFLGGANGWLSSIGEETAIPFKFHLSQNYPNPFNSATMINYSIAGQSHVRIDIYNILGQLVENLVDEIQEPGNHSLVWNSGKLPSGVYFFRLKAGKFENARKMMLLK